MYDIEKAGRSGYKDLAWRLQSFSSLGEEYNWRAAVAWKKFLLFIKNNVFLNKNISPIYEGIKLKKIIEIYETN